MRRAPGTRGVHRRGRASTVEAREGELYRVRFAEDIARACSSATARCRCRRTSAHAPQRRGRRALPDRLRARPGAVAAPTAGLHFDRGAAERARGARRDARATSRCTSAPARSSRCASTRSQAHRMHSERYAIPPATLTRSRDVGAASACSRSARPRCARSKRRRATGRSRRGRDRPLHHARLQFRVVERLLTNFHLPQSTLLMLVCGLRRHRQHPRGLRARDRASATASSATATRC